jgi:hypothetical protein
MLVYNKHLQLPSVVENTSSSTPGTKILRSKLKFAFLAKKFHTVMENESWLVLAAGRLSLRPWTGRLSSQTWLRSVQKPDQVPGRCWQGEWLSTPFQRSKLEKSGMEGQFSQCTATGRTTKDPSPIPGRRKRLFSSGPVQATLPLEFYPRALFHW